MDIEAILNQLIFQYNIDKHMPKYGLYVKAKKIAKDVVKELSEKYSKIILIGSKETDIKWFRSCICNRGVIEFCVDSKEKIEISDEYLKQENCLLNISLHKRDWIKQEFAEKQVFLFDLYDIFQKNDLFFSDDFYDVYQCEYYSFRGGKPSHDMADFDMNHIFFRHRREFEEEKNDEIKRKKLEVLIFDLVFAKDFLLLKEYIDIYVNEYDSEFSKEYIDFYHAVENLLHDIKMKLQAREQKDCIMVWLDALEYGEDKTLSFFDKIHEDCISFEKIFTVTPYTGPTFKTLFSKSRTVEENSYKITKVGKNNSELINALEQRNYEFQYHGYLKLAEEYEPLHYYTIYSTITELYWNIIGSILLSEQKFFCVLHEVLQTHVPYISLGLKGENCSFTEDYPGQQQEWEVMARNCQVMESREYVDKQLKFWSNLLPERMYKIYMSDHGHTFFGRYHAILKIQQKDILPMKCEKVVSYYDFDKIVLQVLDHYCIKEDELCKGNAIIQDVDYYNKDYILTIANENDFSPDELIGYQGIVTEKDMLLHYKHGVEYYQKLVNDEEMVSDQRLEYLRNMLSKKEIDIETEEKFQYSRIVWNAYRRCKERTKDIEEKKIELIKNIFNNIPSDAILAIRGGGRPTVRLLMMLEEELRRKVCYLVDRNKECPAGRMGIKVINQEEMKDYHIDFLLLSSYQYRDVWKEEMIPFQNIKIIDMYDIFKENGIYCNRDFYHLTYEKEDFEG
ncbi:MAG: hypothetical protein IJA32_05605 [Lachnospiraceae bacterium]|nr:hypothetical protein [Lachnospiraceae bacterium]